MNRFKTLTLLSDLCRAIGYIFIVIDLIAACGVCSLGFVNQSIVRSAFTSQGQSVSPTALALASFAPALCIVFLGLFTAVPFLLAGENIRLNLTIEENTRKSANTLDQILARTSTTPGP